MAEHRKPGPAKGSPSPNPHGRPRGQVKFKRPQQLEFLKSFAASHCWQRASDDAGVSYAAVNGLYKRDAAFHDEVEDARRRYFDRLVGAANQRAVDGVKDFKFGPDGEKHELLRYSDVLLLALLKRHIPEFREKVELTQDPEKPIKHEVDLRTLSPEERKLARALVTAELQRIATSRNGARGDLARGGEGERR